MFMQTRVDQGEGKYTSGWNSSQGDSVPGKYVQLYRHTYFYECHRYGHFSDQFPEKQPKSINIAIIGVILMQNGEVIKKTWILLHTCSIDSVANNLNYVEDVNNYARHK